MTTEAQNPSTESTTDMDKVIARIQKILSRASTTSGTTEAEADTALKMAQELAMKHNLDLAAIEASAVTNGNPNAPAERVKDELKGRAMYKWQRQLAKYVAEANFCYHLIQERHEWVQAQFKLDDEWLDNGKPNQEAKELGLTKVKISYDERDALGWDKSNKYSRITDGRRKTTHKHIFVGRKGNVVTAQMMFQYLTQTIEDLVVSEMNLTNAQRLSRSAMSWKEGAGDRLCERLAARRKDLIDQHDARVKQQEEDRLADAKRAAAEKAAKEPKHLTADHETEVKAAYEGMQDGMYDLSGANEAEDAERPDIDADEPWTPEGEEIPEPVAGTAMVLASVFDKQERDANYEMAHGMEPGTLARWQAERDERQRKEAEAEAEEEQDSVEAPVKAETERQRNAREAREEREYQANRRRWAREDARDARREAAAYAKRDHRAYRAGAEKGKSIGLDIQLKAGKDTKKLS